MSQQPTTPVPTYKSSGFDWYTFRSTPFLLFTVVFLLVLTLYGLTLAPGVVGGDAGEHQFAVPLLGIPHTTGYPLYVLTGKLWTLLLPVGSPAWRLNLFSAVTGALAAAVTALVVYHLWPQLARSRELMQPLWAGALLAGLTLAAGLTLWRWSIIAGVRSLNVLFFALLTLAAIIWQQQLERGDNRAAERTLRWLALTVGLSLAHHRTTLFFLPSLIGWVWWHDRRLIFQVKRWAVLLALALAPLSLYAFIYLRGVNNPPYSHEQISDWSSFWFLVGSGDSSGLFLSFDPVFIPARLLFIWHDLLRQLAWPGLILAGLGGLLLLWRQPKHFLFQAVLGLLLLLFTLDFEVVNLAEAPTWYLMPLFFILSVWVGLGINGILDLRFWIYDICPMGLRHLPYGFAICDLRLEIGRRFTLYAPRSPLSTPRSPLYAPRFISQSLIVIMVIGLLAYTLAWPNWQQIYAESTAPLDEWRQLLRGAQAQRLVEASLPQVAPNSIIWADWEQYTPLRYYQFIEGLRPDVTVRNPLNNWPEKVAAARRRGQEVYLARKTTDLIGTPHLSMVGPLIHVQAGPRFDPPAGLTPLNADFEGELELLGYRAEIIPQPTPGGSRAGDILQLSLAWRAAHRLEWDYALSLRLGRSPANGQPIYQRDVTHPVLSSYPTSLWTPGEVVVDFYELPVPPGATPLTLHLLPYRTEGPGRWHNLTLAGAEPPQDGIFLGPFE